MSVVSADRIREALLALEGTVIGDLRLPLPGDLRDIAKAADMVSGIVEDHVAGLRCRRDQLSRRERRLVREIERLRQAG